MRILQLVNRFDFGGAENHVRELCNELAAMDHKVVLATRNGRQRTLLDNRVKFICIPSWVASILFTHTILIIFLALRNRIEVIHAHQRLPIISACLAGKILGIPVVATVHGRVRHDLRSAIARKLCTSIIFVSQQVLNVSRHYENIRHKSVIIPNGIPLPEKLPSISPFAIGYISRIDGRHSEVIRHLISSVEILKPQFPEIRLFLIGDGNGVPELMPVIDATNQRLNEEAIRYMGFISKLEIDEFFPELVLGVGRVAIEALARGANVISVNSKRMGHIVVPPNYNEYAINNFVHIHGMPPSKESLYVELKTFFDNRDDFRQKAAIMSDNTRKDFGIRQTTQRIVDLYSSLSTHSNL